MVNNQSSELPLLAASGICKNFGGIKAVNDAKIEVAKGSITGLIGPNGAGKTTLFNLLSNFIRPDKGRVIFDENIFNICFDFKLLLEYNYSMNAELSEKLNWSALEFACGTSLILGSSVTPALLRYE